MNINQQPDSYFFEINNLFRRIATLPPDNIQAKKEILGEIQQEIERLRNLNFRMDEYEKKLQKVNG